ncbi:MAG: integrase core domain-containing protein [Candidatus Nitrotoga sp.]
MTYPKTPKMNAHVERFNGSIQNEFVAYHEDLLFTDVNLFNDKLLDYLVWFNTERPHYGLGLISPYEYLKHTISAICIGGRQRIAVACKVN